MAREPEIRRYEPPDFDAVNDLWRRSRLRAFPDLQARKGHTAEEDREYFRDVVLVRHDVWVVELDGRDGRLVRMRKPVN